MSLPNENRIGDFRYEVAVQGIQAAGTLWQPSATFGEAELGTDEIAEIETIEVWSPKIGLNPEDLEYLYLIVDGQSTQNLLNISGRDDISTNPPRIQTVSSDPHRIRITLGKNIVDCFDDPIPALSNTTLKVSDRVTLIARAGAADVTQDYRVKLFGYLWNDRLLRRIPNKTMPGNFVINDMRRDRKIEVPFPSVEITRQNWSILPGGIDQEPPKIMPFMRFATNSSPTVANTRYDFRFELQNVDDQFKDLRFQYDLENRLLLVRGLGARAHANSRFVWLYTRGDEVSEDMPPDRFKVEENNNEIHFGHGFPQFPLDQPIYAPIPQYGVNNHIIWREDMRVSMMDNGTPVPPEGVAVVLLGKRIDFGGKV